MKEDYLPQKKDYLPQGVSIKNLQQMEDDLQVEFAESSDGGGDWFVYSVHFFEETALSLAYREVFSSCECIEDAWEWYKEQLNRSKTAKR